mgnify:CR=1 FL=1
MRKPFYCLVAGAVAAALSFATPVAAQQKLKIGFITTMSGPQGVIGSYMKDSVELALDHLGRKVGGLDVEVIYGDDQIKPDVGVQVAEEMLKKDQVDIVAGIIWSNVMMAVVPVVTGAGKVMVGTNAGASPLAGEQCNEAFFSTSWNNDESPEAMGQFLQESGVDDLYVLGLGSRFNGPEDVSIVTTGQIWDQTGWIKNTENGPKFEALYKQLAQTFDDKQQHSIVAQMLKQFDVAAVGGTPKAAKDYLVGEVDKWRPIVKAADFKMPQ